METVIFKMLCSLFIHIKIMEKPLLLSISNTFNEKYFQTRKSDESYCLTVLQIFLIFGLLLY